jgi:itaconate CoA-transferase
VTLPRSANGSLPLDGILVVGIEQAVAAPFCTRELSDLGARVIKVEPAEGDFARHYDDVVHGTSAYFAWANRGKESLVLDLKSDTGRADLEALLSRADVFVQNLGPGAAARMDLDSAALIARFPRLVAVDISGYGAGGPRSDARAHDMLVLSESGICSVTGTPGNPIKPGVPLIDIGTGLHSTTAILAALFARTTTGKGAAIQLSMFDVATDWMSWALHRARFWGENVEPVGMASPIVAPYAAYATADEQVIVLGTTSPREWKRLTEMIDQPGLADDPRFATNADRVAHRSALDAVIGDWMGSHDFADIADRATAAGLGWARFNRPTDVLVHPQLVERNRWRYASYLGESFPEIAPAAIVSDWDRTTETVPGIGEHSAAIAAEFGLSIR